MRLRRGARRQQHLSLVTSSPQLAGHRAHLRCASHFAYKFRAVLPNNVCGLAPRRRPPPGPGPPGKGGSWRRRADTRRPLCGATAAHARPYSCLSALKSSPHASPLSTAGPKSSASLNSLLVHCTTAAAAARPAGPGPGRAGGIRTRFCMLPQATMALLPYLRMHASLLQFVYSCPQLCCPLYPCAVKQKICQWEQAGPGHAIASACPCEHARCMRGLKGAVSESKLECAWTRSST